MLRNKASYSTTLQLELHHSFSSIQPNNLRHMWIANDYFSIAYTTYDPTVVWIKDVASCFNAPGPSLFLFAKFASSQILFAPKNLPTSGQRPWLGKPIYVALVPVRNEKKRFIFPPTCARFTFLTGHLEVKKKKTYTHTQAVTIVMNRSDLRPATAEKGKELYRGKVGLLPANFFFLTIVT